MERQTKHSQAEQHGVVKQQYDEVQSDGRYEEGMARMGIDLSPKQIERAEAIEQREQLGIEYGVGDVMSLNLERQFDIVTAIHLLHYLENAAEIASA